MQTQIRYNAQKLGLYSSGHIGLEVKLEDDGEIINFSRGGSNFEKWVSRELLDPQGWVWVITLTELGKWEVILPQNSQEFQELPEEVWLHILESCGGNLDEIRRKDQNLLHGELAREAEAAREMEDINALAQRNSDAKAAVEASLGKGFQVSSTEEDGVYLVSHAIIVNGKKRKFFHKGNLDEIVAAWVEFKKSCTPLSSGKPKPVKKQRK